MPTLQKIENVDQAQRPSRMVRPNTDSIKLTKDQRILDYGHCCMMLVEKYGKDRGEKSYEDIALNGTNAIWAVATTIQKEKIRMLEDLGITTSELDDHNWFELWTEWRGQNLHRGSKPLFV